MIITLPQQTFTCNNRLNSITISQQDVRDVQNNVNVTKASGLDLIRPRLLKEGAIILSKPLSIIFNRSLLQGYFLLTGRMPMSLPFTKRQTYLCHQITDQYLL